MIALLLFLSVLFHTTTQLDDWFDDWSARVGDDYMSGQLLAELDDMLERHPYWGDPPVTSTTSPRPSSGVSYNVEQWRPLVEQHFNSGDVWRVLCLMAHESQGDPNAFNPSFGASGLMQVLASWADNFGYVPSDLFNPSVNLAIARILRDDGGWRHWSPYNRGLCR